MVKITLTDPPALPRVVLRKLLEFATKKSHFLFDGKYYDQIDGVAMGSPLGSVLANIFMCDFEEKWLTNAKISPSFWNRYVDDTFTMFHNQDSANEFLHYLNGCHSNIKFTIEFEQNNAIPFLDILITRNQNSTFMTSIYRKKTFTGLYTKWDSFTPRKYKINLIRSLTYRYNRLCSSGSLLQSALHDLRKLLLQNGYPQGIINYHINDVLNKNRHQQSNPVSTVPKKDIEDITCPRVDMNFIFEWSTRYLTSERSERVRYRVDHEKIKFISISGHVMFCLLYKHQ